MRSARYYAGGDGAARRPYHHVKHMREPKTTREGRALPIHARSTCTRASLKHAPPPTSLTCCGQSAVDVWPFREELRQAPLGRPQTPSRMRSLIRARQRTSPRSLKTRTSSLSEIRRAAESSGLSVSQSSG